MMFSPKMFLDKDQIEKIYSLEKEGNLNPEALKVIQRSIYIPAILGVLFLAFIIFRRNIIDIIIFLPCYILIFYLCCRKYFIKLIIPFTFGYRTQGTIESAKYEIVTIKTPKNFFIRYSYYDDGGEQKRDFLSLESHLLISQKIKSGDKVDVFVDNKSKNSAPYYKELFSKYCLDNKRITSLIGEKL